MNTNVGDMPIDIFGDYVSDILGEEWTWEYFIPTLNEINFQHGNFGNGFNYNRHDYLLLRSSNFFYSSGENLDLSYGNGQETQGDGYIQMSIPPFRFLPPFRFYGNGFNHTGGG